MTESDAAPDPIARPHRRRTSRKAAPAPQEALRDMTADIVIIGGGLAGLTMAACLGGVGMNVVCVDRDRPEDQLQEAFDGRTTAVALGSQQVLEGAGVWRHVAEAGAILDIRVADDGVPLFVHYDHRTLGDQPFGYIVENRVLRRALMDRLAELPSVTHLAPASMTALERDAGGVRVGLGDGRTVRGRLAIGADGKRSACRAAAGIEVMEWSYGQSGLICAIEHEKPHDGIAVELFLPGGPFAMLPMAGNRTSIVWSEKTARAQELLALDEAAFAAALRPCVGDWLGDFHTIGVRAAYPLGAMHANSYVSRRLALIGEAAHAIHPIAGQGLNLGFRDIAALAEAVVDTWRLGLDVGGPDVLERYQRWRRFDTVALLAVTDGLNRLFSNSLPPVRLARDLGLGAVNRLAPVKRFLMRHAMGMVGELPRLVRGQPL